MLVLEKIDCSKNQRLGISTGNIDRKQKHSCSDAELCTSLTYWHKIKTAKIRLEVTEDPNKHVHIAFYAILAPAKSKQVLAIYVPGMKVLCMRNTV